MRSADGISEGYHAVFSPPRDGTSLLANNTPRSRFFAAWLPYGVCTRPVDGNLVMGTGQTGVTACTDMAADTSG